MEAVQIDPDLNPLGDGILVLSVTHGDEHLVTRWGEIRVDLHLPGHPKICATFVRLSGILGVVGGVKRYWASFRINSLRQSSHLGNRCSIHLSYRALTS